MQLLCFYRSLWIKSIVSFLIYTSLIAYGMKWPYQNILEFLVSFLCAIVISYGICWAYYHVIQKEKQCFRFKFLPKKKFYLLLKKVGIPLTIIFLALEMYILNFSWKDILKVTIALIILIYLTYGISIFYHHFFIKKQL